MVQIMAAIREKKNQNKVDFGIAAPIWLMRSEEVSLLGRGFSNEVISA